MEKELRKAFEDVTTNNVKAILEHSNGTREIVRQNEDHIRGLEGKVASLTLEIEALKLQLSKIQMIIFRGGTS